MPELTVAVVLAPVEVKLAARVAVVPPLLLISTSALNVPLVRVIVCAFPPVNLRVKLLLPNVRFPAA